MEDTELSGRAVGVVRCHSTTTCGPDASRLIAETNKTSELFVTTESLPPGAATAERNVLKTHRYHSFSYYIATWSHTHINGYLSLMPMVNFETSPEEGRPASR